MTGRGSTGVVRARAWIADHRITVFVPLAIALSWAYWLPLAIGSATTEPGVGWPTQMPGLLGPALAAVVVTALAEGRRGLRDFGLRLLRWRVGWWWLPVILTLVAGAVGIAISGVDRATDLTEFNGVSSSAGALATVLIVFVLNGIGEEAGWRGFLTDRLLRRHGLVTTSLLVTLVWAPWHAPLFFLVGSFQEFSALEIIGWLIGLTAGSFLLTWLYRGASSSILVVATWHTAFNFVSGATAASEGLAAAITSTLVMIAALAIVVVELRRRSSPA